MVHEYILAGGDVRTSSPYKKLNASTSDDGWGDQLVSGGLTMRHASNRSATKMNTKN